MVKFMKIFARLYYEVPFIDTSNKILTIAVFDNDELLGVETSDIMNEHSKYAVDKMKKVFDKIKIKTK